MLFLQFGTVCASVLSDGYAATLTTDTTDVDVTSDTSEIKKNFQFCLNNAEPFGESNVVDVYPRGEYND
jgi:hypothetical protein